MAKEKKPQIDPDKFIESFRADSVPTYHTATDSPKSSPEATAEIRNDQMETLPVTVYSPYQEEDADVETKYSNLNMTEGEIEYIKSYISAARFKCVNRNGKPIQIRRKHHEMILNVLSMLDEGANISTYVDNVLTEHFKKYYPIIKGIADKCPPKF